MFTFTDKKDAEEVMRKGPWFVMNHLLSLQCWFPEASVFEIDFSKVVFWVQIHNIPLGTMKVGEVIEVKDPRVGGVLLRTFIRVRVMVDVSKPLHTGCWVLRLDIPKMWVVFRHERLQDVYFKCGIVGHEQKWCDRESAVTVADSKTPKYGPALSAPPTKSLASIADENGRWRNFNKQSSSVQEVTTMEESSKTKPGNSKDDVTCQKGHDEER